MGPCQLPANPNPESDGLRAAVVTLDEWIAKGTAPPQSRYPRLADGTLVAPNRRAVGFPDLVNVSFPDNLANPQFDYDFGPGFQNNDVSGVLSMMPPTVVHVIPAMVAKVDRDGNELPGVGSVLHQAPLGTYVGWNMTSGGFFKGQRCAFIGGYIPFSTTKAERLAAHDPRPSLEERYGSHQQYVNRVRAAAEKAVKERYLLEEDAARLIEQADRSSVLQ